MMDIVHVSLGFALGIIVHDYLKMFWNDWHSSRKEVNLEMVEVPAVAGFDRALKEAEVRALYRGKIPPGGKLILAEMDKKDYARFQKEWRTTIENQRKNPVYVSFGSPKRKGGAKRKSPGGRLE